MHKQETDKKNMEMNKYDDEKKQMQTRYEQFDVQMKPLEEEYLKMKEREERLSSITASKTKVETEYVKFWHN